MANGFVAWIQEHPDVSLAGGAVAVLLIAGQLIKAKAPTTAQPQDLSGLTHGNLVYVPTQTTFQTINKQQSGVFASNDPALTTITGPVNSPPTTTTTTTTNNPPPVVHPGPPPVRVPPPPHPNPPPTGGKSLKWDQHWQVLGGQNLSMIAAMLTPKLRAQGMPGSRSLTWTDLWEHNEGVITKYANMHGHYSNVQNWVFPGETLTVPRWG